MARDGVLDGGPEALQTLIEKAAVAYANGYIEDVFRDPTLLPEMIDSFAMSMIGSAGARGPIEAGAIREAHTAAGKTLADSRGTQFREEAAWGPESGRAESEDVPRLHGKGGMDDGSLSSPTEGKVPFRVPLAEEDISVLTKVAYQALADNVDRRAASEGEFDYFDILEKEQPSLANLMAERIQYHGLTDLSSTLEAVTRNAGKDSTLGMLAEGLLKLNLPGEVHANPLMSILGKSAGSWQRDSRDLTIDPLVNDRRLQETVVHETIHNAIDKKVWHFRDGMHHKLTKEDLTSLRELDALRRHLLSLPDVSEVVRKMEPKAYKEQTRAVNKSEVPRKFFGLLSLNEFVAEALTYHDFQEFLASKKAPLGLRANTPHGGTVWERAKRILRKLTFGEDQVTDDSALAAAFDRTVDLLKGSVAKPSGGSTGKSRPAPSVGSDQRPKKGGKGRDKGPSRL